MLIDAKDDSIDKLTTTANKV